MNRSHLQTAVVALAVALGVGAASGTPALAQAQMTEAEAQDIGGAILAYRSALDALAEAQANGGDVETASAILDAATARLDGFCAPLGFADIDACVAANATGMPEPEPATPSTEEAVRQEPVPAAEPVELEAPAPAPEQMEATDLPPDALLAAIAEYEAANSALATAIAENEDPAPLVARVNETRAAIDQACAEAGAADTTACLDRFAIVLTPMAEVAVQPPEPADVRPDDVAPEPSAERGITEAPEPAQPESAPASIETEPAEAETPVNPAGTPLPRELGAAIGAYEQANRDLAATLTGTPEAENADAAVDNALAGVKALCDGLGATDIATCLGTYGVALTPRAAAMAEPAEAPTAEPAAPEREAPLLDSAKETEQAETDGGAPPEEQKPREPAAPPPQSDADAQAEEASAPIASIEAEQATGTETATDASAPPRTAAQAPEGAEVVQQAGPRIVIKFNNQLIVSNQADTRLDYGASQRYVENLPRGRVRETILRANGTRLVTVYDRYGNVLRRSHFDANGNETILAYVPETYDGEVQDWRDPGQNLPPLQLDIPAQDYVLDASRASFDSLTGFLSAPPVERVQRLYSIDEVKRSARLRDMVRRLEIGNLTFQTGSASIPPDQIGSLAIVANAMIELIERNPGETFLIEGHTDAVGSDLSNLVLSDARAYSVAIALTEVFGIPPENIATQGYGERYLKVKTEAAEKANRRVTIRRITALIAPATPGLAAN